MDFIGHALNKGSLVLAAWAVLALAAVPGLLRLGTDNSPSVYFVEGSPSLDSFRDLEDAFGGGERVRILVTGEGLWTADALAWMGELERRAAEEVPHATGAIGLAGHHEGLAMRGGEPWPPEDPEAFRRRAAADPLDRQLGLVGAGGDGATVLVVLEAPDEEGEAEAVAALRELAASGPAQDGVQFGVRHGALEARVVGMPVIGQALDASSREIGRVYFPLLVGLAVLLLAATLRSLRGVVLPLLFVAAPETVLLGAMGYLGVDLNLVLAVLPPLLFVISLATAVHLLVRFRDALDDRLAPDAAVRETYRDKGWSVFWTGVTTMIGFGSLTVSRVGPVPDLGIASAAGIGLMTVAAFTLYPVLLARFGVDRAGAGVELGARPARPRTFERRFRRLGGIWAHRAARRRGIVLGVAALVVAGALAGIPRLRIESNAVRFLPPEHPARTGIEALEERGIGAAAVEVLLTLPEGEDFREADRLGVLERLAAELRGLPRVLGAVGGGDLLAAARARLPVGPVGGVSPVWTPEQTLDALRNRPAGRELLRAFVTEDGRRARITLFVEATGHRELEPTLEATGRAAREALPETEVALTGEFPLMLETHRRLLATLGLSLTLTTLAVGLLFRWLLPSTRLTLLALAPNLWPVVATVGVMGWAGVPLDTATVMVASVVLGLAVDDTIHTLGHFRELAPRLGRLEAVAGTLERTAPAYLLTGAILAAGFGVCALSEFAPTARFGGLSALAIALAVLGDLFLLPALLGSTPHAVIPRLGKSDRPPTGRP